MDKLTIIKPDDWHLHLRDGAVLQMAAKHTAAQFARAIIMPNLAVPITTVQMALDYRQRILHAAADFTPLMTLYLTKNSAAEIKKAGGQIYACKLYPAGVTTNSAHGVSDIKACYPVFEQLQKDDMPLLIHGEVADADCDIFDREKIFIVRVLADIVRNFPDLRIVLEHITTGEAVDFVLAQTPNIAATITPQHLLCNRNAMLAGGIRPHYYCLPVLKRERHRQRLISAATSGNSKFFLGSDSAPHATTDKENSCGCAGCYSGFAALELYAKAFADADALHRLEGFASFFGADFYRLPRNTATVTIAKQAWQVPNFYSAGAKSITPLFAGQTLPWKLISQ